MNKELNTVSVHFQLYLINRMLGVDINKLSEPYKAWFIIMNVVLAFGVGIGRHRMWNTTDGYRAFGVGIDWHRMWNTTDGRAFCVGIGRHRMWNRTDGRAFGVGIGRHRMWNTTDGRAFGVGIGWRRMWNTTDGGFIMLDMRGSTDGFHGLGG